MKAPVFKFLATGSDRPRWPFRPWHYRLWTVNNVGEKVFDHAWTAEVVGIAFALGVALGMVIVWVVK